METREDPLPPNTTPSPSSESITRPSCLPQRYLVLLMILLMTINLYANRAITGETIDFFADVKHTIKITTTNQCSEQHQIHEETKNFTKIFQIEKITHEEIQALFFITYMITHVPGGIYSDTRGPKHLLSFLTATCSLINFIMPSLLKATKGNHNVMRVVALVMGAAQGIFFPATSNMIAHWAPVRERASLMSIAVAGLFLGITVTKSGTRLIVKSSGDWTTPFYVFGGVGVFLTLIWEVYVFSDPHQDPRITPEEKEYLDLEMRGTVDHRRKSIPYVAILTSPQVWIMVFAHMANRWLWNFIALKIPVYIKDVLKYSDYQANEISSLPYLLMTVTLVSVGFLSDWITRNGYINILTMRKYFTSLGMMGPPIYILTGSYANCNGIGAITMFVCGMSFMAFSFLGLYLLPMDLAPNYAGFLTTFTNGFGNISGFFLKRITAAVAPDKTILQYRKLFWITLLIATVANTMFVIFGSSRLQPWNRPLIKRK
nr:PREDICTED: sialin [Tribolium castaneum]|eukprot:XP_015838306.1 PREDICTED: sialin [Tribolium castaneum]